jgi:ribosomal protein S18 acetylase RimI-like enzyme
MTDDIEIRRLTPADAALFRDFRLKALQRSPDGFASSHEAEKDRELSWFEARLADTDVFVAFRGVQPLGMAGFRREAACKMTHKGMLWGMYVSPEARGLGLGRKLVQAVLDHAEGKVETVQLAVTTENPAARALYEAMGFEVYATEPRSLKVGDRYWDDLLMARAV